MANEVQLRFDYDALDRETRAFVQERAERLHRLARGTAAAIVQMGQDLTEVKERLREHNKGRSRQDQERLGFLEWIKREFAWKIWTADQFMKVYREFKMVNFTNLEIDVSALYLIAKPSTPEPVRQEAIRQAVTGPVTHATVKAVVTEYKKTGDQTGAVSKLFDVVNAAQRQHAEDRKLLPSPAEARRKAIETGAHTLDRNGVLQPPMSVEDQQTWRADLHHLGPLREFIRWVSETKGLTAAGIVEMIDARRWRDDFDDQQATQAAVWLTEFGRKLCQGRRKASGT